MKAANRVLGPIHQWGRIRVIDVPIGTSINRLLSDLDPIQLYEEEKR